MNAPKDPNTLAQNPSPVEVIKDKSNFLRGTIIEGLADPITGAISSDDTQLTKFHGTYQQDDRERRLDRKKKKLEPYYTFMIRCRLPGGVCTSDQWLAMDKLADQYANNTLKITTRQTFQLHGVIKRDLKATFQGINACLVDTKCACGDVCRNTLVTSNPYASAIHTQVYELAKANAENLLPKSRAYYEVWLDGEKVEGNEEEPIYSKHYLPRKFKIAWAIPPDNEIDVFSNDLGFIAIIKNGKLEGFNIACGGGMGMTHNTPTTYPRLGSIIGFCKPEQTMEVAKHIVMIQRDFGDRSNRAHARFKYTIDDRGVDWLRDEVNSRLGWKLGKARDYEFSHMGDTYGWVKGTNGNWYLTVHIEHGRVKDVDGAMQKTGLREIAKTRKCEFRLTCNQGLVLGNIATKDKAAINKLVKQYALDNYGSVSGLRKNSIACAALPYCALSMAESERYLPTLMDKIEPLLKSHGLLDEPIVIRMTGCPNGCGRPYNAEIGLVGKSMGRYNLYLGASFTGDRMNKQYKENITEEEILAELDPLFAAFAKSRKKGEHFGDFCVRVGVIKATTEGLDFWAE